MKKCSIKGCRNKYRCIGFCGKHYRRFLKHGDPNKSLKAEHGSGFIHEGYHCVMIAGKRYKTHRYIYEQYLGRSLTKEENIHHINGDKLDNRIENLELWSTKQPYGQRMEDKLKYAREIIALYGDDDVYFW